MASLKRKAPTDAANSSKKVKADASLLSFFTPPKAAASGSNGAEGAAEASQPKFDKVKWVSGLTSEQRKLLQLEIAYLHESWLYHLKDEITSPEFLELKRFLEREFNGSQKIFPPKEDIYSWSRHTPFNNVKIVIVGQDPYHGERQAHGLAFSVRPPTPPPPSLRNMFVALKKDYPSFVAPPKNGLLTPWAERGVLMLNTCLTVRAHQANSHANRGWERFTQKVIDTVAAKRTRGVVFLAWGSPAGKRVAKIDQRKHLVLKSVHPSPLSASRGFFDCGHFRKSNEWLVTRYGLGSEVDWSLGGPPAPEPSGKKVEEKKVEEKKVEEKKVEEKKVEEKKVEKKVEKKKAEAKEEIEEVSEEKEEEAATPVKEKGKKTSKKAAKKAEEAKKNTEGDETEEEEEKEE